MVKICKPLTILLAEDDDAHAELIEITMKQNGVNGNIYRVRDGVEAMSFLRKIDEHKDAPTPDVILLDIAMPKKDGLEVLQEIKFNTALQQIPVVMLTTSISMTDRKRAYECFVNSYVCKPIQYEQFQNFITQLGVYWTTINIPLNDDVIAI